ncbi:MAG: type IV secretion system DNA-binding domain-containing protein [Acidihalobacter sp.]|uniref:type IV secretion system DNA-binding domain-containing protein n=1 Tax=Acidihalobacter sp. TaxID=1872108 RepID=UPI00307ED8E7
MKFGEVELLQLRAAMKPAWSAAEKQIGLIWISAALLSLASGGWALIGALPGWAAWTVFSRSKFAPFREAAAGGQHEAAMSEARSIRLQLGWLWAVLAVAGAWYMRGVGWDHLVNACLHSPYTNRCNWQSFSVIDVLGYYINSWGIILGGVGAAAALIGSIVTWRHLVGLGDGIFNGLKGGGTATGRDGDVLLRGTAVRSSSGRTLTDDITQIGGVPIQRDDEPQGFLLQGSTGSGKSTEFRHLMRTARARGERAVVYDPTGEYVERFYREGVDHILCPLDARDARWDPMRDFEGEHEIEEFAAGLIPSEPGSKNAFFEEGARAMFTAALTHFGSVDEAVAMIMAGEIGDLMDVITAEGLGGMVGGSEKSLGEIRNSAAVFVRSLSLLHPARPELGASFSIREWLHSEDDSWLFLPAPGDALQALRPLLSAAMDMVIRKMMTLSPDSKRRLWVYLDELPTLQRLPAVNPLTKLMRKYGVVPVLGFQAKGDLDATYGRDRAGAILGQLATRLLMRASDPDTSEWTSKDIGDQHIRRITSSTNQQGSGMQASSTRSEQEQIATERAVLPAEIQKLPDLTGYLRTPGQDGVLRVQLEYLDLPVIAEGFQRVPPRPRPKPVPPTAS